MSIKSVDRSIEVAMIYHFYPHYREGIIASLHLDKSCQYSFFGGGRGIEGIAVLEFPPGTNFDEIYTFRVGSVVIQPGVLWLCLTGSYDCFCFLADPNHLTNWLGALICRLRRRRVVFWGHGFKDTAPSTKNSLRSLFFSLANGFYTYGYRAKEIAVRMGFSPDSIYVGFNSLDYGRQLAVRTKMLERKRSVPADGAMHIVCISRLTRACRYDMLFDAIAEARARGLGEVSVTVIGAGPELTALRSQAGRLQIAANFAGPQYDEETIASYLFKADVTVSPGKVGLTAMHSLMYGTPVISNSDFVAQMPEVEAIVPRYTGELFESNDISDLAEKLLMFKERFPDREATRQNCFRMVDQIYNPTRQAEVMRLAVHDLPAPLGDDAFQLFGNAP